MAHQAQAIAHSYGTHFLLVKHVKTRSKEDPSSLLFLFSSSLLASLNSLHTNVQYYFVLVVLE